MEENYFKSLTQALARNLTELLQTQLSDCVWRAHNVACISKLPYLDLHYDVQEAIEQIKKETSNESVDSVPLEASIRLWTECLHRDLAGRCLVPLHLGHFAIMPVENTGDRKQMEEQIRAKAAEGDFWFGDGQHWSHAE